MTDAQWAATRRRTVGGSDAAAILGLHPYVGAYELWARKLGYMPEVADNEAMRQGRDLEDYVARRFSELSGKAVRRDNAILYNDAYPFAHANIDRRIVGEAAGLECKATGALNLHNYADSQFPAQFYVQCAHYMMVTGYRTWYLAVMVCMKDFLVYRLSRDRADIIPEWCAGGAHVSDGEIDVLSRFEQTFVDQCLRTGVPPAVDGSASTDRALSYLYASREGTSINLDDMEADMAERIKATRDKKEAMERETLYTQRFKAAMQEHERAECAGMVITWKEDCNGVRKFTIKEGLSA